MEESLNNSHKRFRLHINNDIIVKSNTKNYSKRGKIVWFYTKNGEKITEKIEKSSTLAINTMTIGETSFDSENGTYSCKFDIEKCHINFEVGMVTVRNCDFMGYTNAINFVKCDNDVSFPSANIEFNDNSTITLSVTLKDNENNKLTIPDCTNQDIRAIPDCTNQDIRAIPDCTNQDIRAIHINYMFV